MQALTGLSAVSQSKRKKILKPFALMGEWVVKYKWLSHFSDDPSKAGVRFVTGTSLSPTREK